MQLLRGGEATTIASGPPSACMYAVMLFQVFHVLQSMEAMLIVAMELLLRRYFKCKFTKTSKHARIIDANVSYVTHKGWGG